MYRIDRKIKDSLHWVRVREKVDNNRYITDWTPLHPTQLRSTIKFLRGNIAIEADRPQEERNAYWMY